MWVEDDDDLPYYELPGGYRLYMAGDEFTLSGPYRSGVVVFPVSMREELVIALESAEVIDA